MAEAGKVQALFMYGFIRALLILMAVMLATTPVPEWMDGSGDEGPTIGGPITHRQEKRMPLTFENGVDGGQEQEGEDDPYDEPDVQGYGSKTLVSSEAGTYGIHVTGREPQTGQLAQAQGIRFRHASTSGGPFKNPLNSKQLRAIRHARRKSKAFYTQGDQTVPV